MTFLLKLAPIFLSALFQDPRPVVIDPPEPVAAVVPEAEPARLRERYSFVTFGDDILSLSTLVVEGSAESVHPVGNAVSVSRLKVTETLLGKEQEAVTILAPPEEVRSGVTYILFLSPFGEGGRYQIVRRIVKGDRDYKSKRDVLRRFAELHAIVDTDERALAIRDQLIENLGSSDLFTRWNALSELQAFIPKHKMLFGREERVSMMSLYEGAPSPTFQRGVGGLMKELGLDLNPKGGGR